MIQDLDGGDLGPNRVGVARAVSIVLAVGALIGWAAVSSTVFRGPYATPHPLAGTSMRPLLTIVDLVSFEMPRFLCAPPALTQITPDPDRYIVVQPATLIAPDGMAFRITVPPILDSPRQAAPTAASIVISCRPVDTGALTDLFAR